MKRKLKILLLIILLWTFIVTIGLYINNNHKNISTDTTTKKDKVIMTTFLILDRDKVQGKMNIKEGSESGHVIKSLRTGFRLRKEDDYYVAVMNDVNSVLFENTMDYAFTLNDYNGNVINDCIYESKNKKLKVPKHYFENEKRSAPVQFELMLALTQKQVKNTKIDMNVKRIFEKKWEVETDSNDLYTYVSISKYKKFNKIQKDNMRIYVNDSNKYLRNEDYSWNSKSGVVTIYTNPLLIKKIDVKVNGNTFVEKVVDSLFVSKNVKALSYSKMEAYYKELDSIDEHDWSGKSWSGLDLTLWYYNNNASAVFPDSDAGKARKKAYDDGIDYVCRTNGNCGEDAAEYHSFILDLSGLDLTEKVKTSEDKNGNPVYTTYHIKFKSNTYVSLFCIGHTQGTNVSGNSAKRSVNISVKAYKAGKYLALQFTTTNRLNNQIADGVVKFDWSNDYGNIKVTKQYLDGSTATTGPLSGIKVRLYDGHNCTAENKITTKSTNSSGVAKFKNLEYDTYSIQEVGGYNTNDWEYITGCKNFTLNKNDPIVDGVHTQSLTIQNRRKKYCYKVKKVDADNNSCTLSGISFKNSDGSTLTTGADGIVTFQNLLYGSYSFTESSTDRTVATSSCGGTYKYWNENTTATAATLTLMTYANGTYSCPAGANTVTKSDHKVYYCLKVQKKDKATNESLEGAVFKNNTQNTTAGPTLSDGIATFMLGTTGGKHEIEEITAPTGYALSSPSKQQVDAVEMPKGTTYAQSQTKSSCAAPVGFTYKNPVYFINWYKKNENTPGVKLKNAEFTVANSSGTKLYHKADKVSAVDDNGTTKSCYVVSDTSTGTGSDIFVADDNGEVCVRGIAAGNYTVTETKPAQYHTFECTNTRTVTANTNFQGEASSNTFVNYPTEFEFTKDIDANYKETTDNDKYKDLTTEELKKLKFNVTNNAGTLLNFYKKKDSSGNVIEGEYEYAGNDLDINDISKGDLVTDLQLNSNRKIKIYHLPWKDSSNENGALYSIKEKENDDCKDKNSNVCNGNGYYYPEYSTDSTHQFRIYQTSRSNCDSSNPPAPNLGTKTTQTLANTPTEIKFTKKDIYRYYYTNDIVKFENEEELRVFDDITFRLKDAQGNYLELMKVSDGVYRYVKHDDEKTKVTGEFTTDLHTKNGDMTITHLCRDQKYVIEEYAVPDGTVFILPTPHPEVEYNIPKKESSVTPTSKTHVINDTPTRVRLEKRDAKYNYLIPDEATTFEVYRCKKGTECHPSDKDSNAVLVRFWNRAKISNTDLSDGASGSDNEDPTDAEGVTGVELYKFLSTSDEKSLNESQLKDQTTTQLHPYHGILILRYLPANYDYVLLEVKAPINYTLPTGQNAETKFSVVDNTVNTAKVDVPNKPTALVIRKYDDKGNLLPEAEFKIYDIGENCDKNVAPINQKRGAPMKFKTIRDGVYENRKELDSDTILTCKDRDDAKCSDISTNELTLLTHNGEVNFNSTPKSDGYLNTFADFKNTYDGPNGKAIEIKEGEALVQYLEYGHCYVIQEVKAPKGHSIPEETADQFSMVVFEENESYYKDTYMYHVNKPTPFKFYKYDEFNQLLDGAKFKLQKLDKDKKYHDVTVTKDENEEDGFFYKVDPTTDNTTILTKNGSATVYYLEQGQYRIVETEAPAGKELQKNLNVATFFVDAEGRTFGNSIITNKPTTIKIPRPNSAQAELIVNIQTGQTVIKYGLIITILIGLISTLMYLRKRTK